MFKSIIKKLFILKLFILIFLIFGIDTIKATDVGGTISTNTTWTLAGSPYNVTSDITLSTGITLTIEPGVVVKFYNGAGLTVFGTLLADGTNTDKIIFTSINDHSVGGSVGGTGSPAAGNWDRIYLNTGSDASLLDYVEVKYAGNLTGGIYITGSSPAITNSLLDTNKTNGIYIASGTPTINSNIIQNSTYGINVVSGTPIISGNTIQNNTVGILLPNLELRSSVNDVAANNTYLNNTTYDYASNSFDIDGTSLTVDASVYPIIIINNSTSFNAGQTLTLAPGSIVKFENTEQANIYGTLIAQGTSNNKIIFTSINDNTVGGATGTGNPGSNDWSMIYFNGTGADGSILDYVEVKYAYQINVTGASPTITNSIIENNYYGINVVSGTPIISGNTIQNNTVGILLPNLELRSSVNDVAANNTYLNNTTYDYASNSFDIDGTSLTVDASVYPIIIINNSTVLSVGQTLTLTPGSIVKFANTEQMNIYGTLLAQGTSTDKIIFTSVNDHSVGGDTGTGTPSANNWSKIYFNGTGADGSILDYVEVRYAYEIYIVGSSPTITNSIIENNYYGIRLASGSPTVNSNIIINNTAYGLYNSGTPNVQFNLFYGNTSGDTYNHTLEITNITGQDPLFVPGTSKLQAGSPAIDAGDPAFGNHALSGNRYDIGSDEYIGFLSVGYDVNVTGVGGRTLDYEWSFLSDPTGGTYPPSITNATGSVTTDGNIACSFLVQRTGSYQIKFVIKDGGTEVGSGIRNFTVSN